MKKPNKNINQNNIISSLDQDFLINYLNDQNM